MATVVAADRAPVGGGRLPVEWIVSLAVLGITLWLVFYPAAWLVWGAFHQGAPGADGEWTLANFTALLLDGSYWWLILRSILYGVGATLLATLIGVPLAWLTVKTDMPGRWLVELAAIMPFFTSTFIGGLAWIFIGNPTNGLLKLWFGLPVNIYSPAGIIWVTGLYMAPYMYLFAAGALRNIDTTLEEASFMARAGVFRTMTRVTLPLILPAILSGMSLVLVISMDIFGVAAIIGFPAKVSLLATEVFVKASLFPPEYGQAAVVGLTLVAITSVLVFLQTRLLRRGSYAVLGGRGFQVKRYSLGKWTPLALVFSGLYALVAVLLPYLVLIKNSLQLYPTPRFTAWTLHNWTTLFNNSDLVDTLSRSFVLSTVGATLCVLFTAVLAYIIHRGQVPGRKLLDYVSVMPIGIPGIVMGLGIMWAYITWPVWGTIWILVIAYVTLFLPYGVRSLGSAVMQINPELEESSRVHRASWLRTFFRIVMPLLRSGIQTTWMMLFVILIREISAAILLSSQTTQVFPVLIYRQWTQGNFNAMSASAVFLSALILIVVAVFRWGFKVEVTPRSL